MERSISTIRSIQTRRSIDPAGLFIGLLLLLVAASVARAADEHLQVFVAEPYLELRTGPGRGYPVTHIVGRGDSVEVLKRRTDWLKVRTERGIEGWAYQRDMAKTLLADGTRMQIDMGDRSGFTSHRWEAGAMVGDFDGANLVSAYGAFSLNDHLKIDVSASQFLGVTSNATPADRSGYTLDIGLNHVFMPEWRFSPFVTLGGGLFNVNRDPQNPAAVDLHDQSAYVGAGARYYLTRRFFLRGEYKHRVVFTSRDDNEELEEWKVGLGFFF